MSKLTLKQGISELSELMKARKLIVFAGSGISVASGLPTWDKMLEGLIDFCDALQSQLPADQRFDDLLAAARKKTASYPTHVASVLREKLRELQRGKLPTVDSMFKKYFQRMLYSKQPNENHHLIVKTDFPYILTTNYDTLLEDAAENEGFEDLVVNTYSFNDPALVAGALYQEKPSIIHLHGDVLNIALDEFIFTMEDYVRIKKRHSGFTMAIQTLFLRYSVLFVGYGGSDPHLEDFVEELAYALDWPTFPSFPLRYFLVTKGEKADIILEKYKDKLRTELIALDQIESDTPNLLRELQKIAPRERRGSAT
jgi:hypothetical protein